MEYIKNNSWADELIEKIDSVMKDLLSLKNSSKLRKETTLRPERRNRTRWSSIFNMLTKYHDIQPAFSKCNFSDDLKSKLLNPLELSSLSTLLETFQRFNEVTLILQTHDYQKIDASFVRTLFDGNALLTLSLAYFHNL